MWQPTNLATLIWEVCAINIPSAITLFKHYPLPYFPRCFKICVWNVSNKNINKIKEERDLHCLAQKHSQAHFKTLCCWWYGQGTSMFVSLSSCIHHIFGTRHPKAKSYTVSRRRFRSTPRTKIWWSLEPRPSRQKEEGDMPSVPSASLVAARKRMGNMSKSFAACSPEVRLYQSWSVSLLVPALRRLINWACFTLFFPPFFSSFLSFLIRRQTMVGASPGSWILLKRGCVRLNSDGWLSVWSGMLQSNERRKKEEEKKRKEKKEKTQ